MRKSEQGIIKDVTGRYQGIYLPDQGILLRGDFPEIMERWIAARRAAGGHRAKKKTRLQVVVETRATTTSRPTAFVLDKTFEESDVASFPVAQLGFLDHDR
jgi:hypothetical protein